MAGLDGEAQLENSNIQRGYTTEFSSEIVYNLNHTKNVQGDKK